MRWTPGNVSGDIEDRRGSSSGGGFGFGRGPTIGCGTAIVLLVLSLLTGKNFFSFFSGSGGDAVQQAPTETAAPASESPEEHKMVLFLSDILDDNQATWEKILAGEGVRYQRAKLVLYRDLTPTACGTGQSASGPFYCPSDGKVYLDLAD
jgi:predicted metalloprotease